MLSGMLRISSMRSYSINNHGNMFIKITLGEFAQEVIKGLPAHGWKYQKTTPAIQRANSSINVGVVTCDRLGSSGRIGFWAQHGRKDRINPNRVSS